MVQYLRARLDASIAGLADKFRMTPHGHEETRHELESVVAERVAELKRKQKNDANQKGQAR